MRDIFMKSRVLSKVLLIFTLMITCVTSVFAKDNNKLLVNGKDFGYDILLKNGVSYMRADDFLDMFASEPPIKTNKSITYIKRCIPTQDSFFEIEYKDNSIAWNGKKTGAYAINSNGELYIPIKSVCKYLFTAKPHRLFNLAIHHRCFCMCFCSTFI